jgi:hypothetical protein
VTEPRELTEYEKYQFGSTLPFSAVHGSVVMYKMSPWTGIWPKIAALPGYAAKNNAEHTKNWIPKGVLNGRLKVITDQYLGLESGYKIELYALKFSELLVLSK